MGVIGVTATIINQKSPLSLQHIHQGHQMCLVGNKVITGAQNLHTQKSPIYTTIYPLYPKITSQLS